MRGLLLLLLALPTAASEVKKPAGLTPKEVADGWLQLFDGETTMGWVTEGEAKVEDGVLVFGGAKPAKARMSSAWTSYELDVDFQVVGKEPADGRIGISVTNKPGATGNTRLKVTNAIRPVSPIDVWIPAGTQVRIKRAVLRPLNLTPTFNGKDLAGWKVYKGDPKREKSKWTVTKEGWLNVKDGPGDLQTEKLFDDFVLQFDCVSNGKHLNSGLFFRCEPGQYQQGYEAQIRNQFTDKPTQKYAVEEYDPRTNKLVGKKTVMSTAFDFGTGAIYRRVPARKGVARDGEWFTMTVVARGRHIATWVNGVQVVDWTDNRPEGDNARTGYRSKAGAISIQGHDPTTDLSFRNLRIAPLPR
jgi:hypothetical protein